MSIISEDTRINARLDNRASVVELRVNRPRGAGVTHYVVEEADGGKYSAMFMMHEDEFGEMFDRNIVEQINERLRNNGMAYLTVVMEVQ